MYTKYVLLTVLSFLLAGCFSPLSLGALAVGASVGVYSHKQLQREQEADKYINKCIRSHLPVDAYAVGIEEEYAAVLATEKKNDKAVTEHMITAFEHYKIAHKLGDRRALPRIRYFEKIMPANERKEAEARFAKHTDINLHTCFVTVF